jgi:hypothetical protein
LRRRRPIGGREPDKNGGAIQDSVSRCKHGSNAAHPLPHLPSGSTDDPQRPHLLETVLAALGIDLALDARRVECCGGHQGIVDPEGVQRASMRVLSAAQANGCQAVITPCPLCRYNLRQVNAERAFVGAVASVAVAAAAALGVPSQKFLKPEDSWTVREWEQLQALIPCAV